MRTLATVKKIWLTQISLLRVQLRGAPEVTIDATRTYIRKLYNDAKLAGMALPKPTLIDIAFDGMDFSRSEDSIANEMKDYKSTEEKDAIRRAMQAKSQRKHMNKLRRAAGKETRKYKSNQKGTTPCLCGCGERVKAHWKMGHWRTYLAWMQRIERGEMPRESLNEHLQETLRWVPCQRCGGFIPTTDAFGNRWEIMIGYACKDRAKRLGKFGGDPKLIATLLGDKAALEDWKRADSKLLYQRKRRLKAEMEAVDLEKAKQYALPVQQHQPEESPLVPLIPKGIKTKVGS